MISQTFLRCDQPIIKTEEFSEAAHITVKIEPVEEFEIDADRPTNEFEEMIVKTDHDYYHKLSESDLLDSIGVVDEQDGIITVNANVPTSENSSPFEAILPLQYEKFEILPKSISNQKNLDKNFSCNQCTLIFSTKSGLKIHQCDSHSKRAAKKTKCLRCHKFFLSRKIYQDHIFSTICDIAITDYRCDICPMSFESAMELSAHRNNHKLNKFFCRRHCGKSFDLVGLCEAHEYTYHKAEEFICNICKNVFPHRKLLFSHFSSHSDLEIYVCPYCRKWFNFKKDLNDHQKDENDTCNRLVQSISMDEHQNCKAEGQLATASMKNTAKHKTLKEISSQVFPIKRKLKLKPLAPTLLSEPKNIIFDNNIVIKEEPFSDHENTQNDYHLQMNIKNEPMSDNEEQISFNDAKNESNLTFSIKEETPEFTEENISQILIENNGIKLLQQTDISAKSQAISPKKCSPALSPFSQDLSSNKAKNIPKTSRKVNRLKKEQIDVVENGKVIDHLKQQYEKAQGIMSNGNEESSHHFSSSLLNRSSSTESFNDCNDNEKNCSIEKGEPPTLVLPVLTEVDPELWDLRREFPEYRFFWSCPRCPRTYMQKHAFRGHLFSVHNMDKNDMHSLQIKVNPLLFRKSLGETKANKSNDQLTLVNQDILLKPKKDNSKIKNNGFTCPTCGRICSSRIGLNDHIIANCSRDPPYKCPNCEKRFFSASTLNCHRSIHTGDLPYSCKFCNKRFRTRGQVTVHHRTHTGEKPFSCKVCGQNFTHRETLIAHLSRHIGMKRYKCYGCGLQFSCISGLKTHREVRKETCGQLKLNSRALGPRVRVIKGNVVFEPQPEINPYLRSEDPKNFENLTVAAKNHT